MSGSAAFAAAKAWRTKLPASSLTLLSCQVARNFLPHACEMGKKRDMAGALDEKAFSAGDNP